jgi:hypothetical protein
METPHEQWPVRVMMISLAASLLLIIISGYVIQTAWMTSAFGK